MSKHNEGYEERALESRDYTSSRSCSRDPETKTHLADRAHLESLASGGPDSYKIVGASCSETEGLG